MQLPFNFPSIGPEPVLANNAYHHYHHYHHYQTSCSIETLETHKGKISIAKTEKSGRPLSRVSFARFRVSDRTEIPSELRGIKWLVVVIGAVAAPRQPIKRK